MIRILHFVSSININSGVMSVLMNYYRYLDTNQIQFDFIYFTKNEVQSYEKEIHEKGGRSFLVMAPNRNPLQFEIDMHSFYKDHRGEYYAVHLHDTFLPTFLIDCKRKLKCKKIIAHAHLTSYGDNPIKSLRNRVLSLPKHFIVDEFWACSHEAGYALAGKNKFDKKGKMLNNAILLERFQFSQKKRDQIRKYLDIEDCFVVGHVGHFSPQKNHKFLIEVFSEIKKNKPNSRLVLVGGGSLKEQTEEICNEIGIEREVLFLGVREDVNELMSAFDVFCLPSKYEGLPFALVESQAVGLPCVYSSEITKEVNIIKEQNHILGLDISPVAWAKAIIDSKRICNDPHERLRSAGFDIKAEAGKLVDLYTN